MGIAYGESNPIVTDSLILHVDPGNSRCYTAGSANVFDLSNNSMVGNLYGGILKTSYGAPAFSFDNTGGDAEYIEFPASPLTSIKNQMSGSVTICTWIRTTNREHLNATDGGAQPGHIVWMNDYIYGIQFENGHIRSFSSPEIGGSPLYVQPFGLLEERWNVTGEDYSAWKFMVATWNTELVTVDRPSSYGSPVGSGSASVTYKPSTTTYGGVYDTMVEYSYNDFSGWDKRPMNSGWGWDTDEASIRIAWGDNPNYSASVDVGMVMIYYKALTESERQQNYDALKWRFQ